MKTLEPLLQQLIQKHQGVSDVYTAAAHELDELTPVGSPEHELLYDTYAENKFRLCRRVVARFGNSITQIARKTDINKRSNKIHVQPVNTGGVEIVVNESSGETKQRAWTSLPQVSSIAVKNWLDTQYLGSGLCLGDATWNDLDEYEKDQLSTANGRLQSVAFARKMKSFLPDTDAILRDHISGELAKSMRKECDKRTYLPDMEE